jgi:FkbM family methyltransferase
VEIEMAGSARLVCPEWSELGSSVVAVGLTDVAELSFLMDVLGAGDVFVDVGANIGLYSAIASRAGAHVIAFEPSDRARAVLERNIAANGGSDSFRCLDCALANESGRLRFSGNHDVGNHLVGESDDVASSVEVEVRRLDDVLASMPDEPSPKVIKVDVEGWDLEVLRGAERTLRSAQPALLVEAWADGREIREWLAEREYVSCTYDWTSGVLAEIPSDFHFHQINLVCIPRSRRDEFDLRVRTGARRVLGEPSVRWI